MQSFFSEAIADVWFDFGLNSRQSRTRQSRTRPFLASLKNRNQNTTKSKQVKLILLEISANFGFFLVVY